MHTTSAILGSDIAEGAEVAQKRLRGMMRSPRCVGVSVARGCSPSCRGFGLVPAAPWLSPAHGRGRDSSGAGSHLQHWCRWLRVLVQSGLGPFPLHQHPLHQHPLHQGLLCGCQGLALSCSGWASIQESTWHVLASSWNPGEPSTGWSRLSTTQKCFFLREAGDRKHKLSFFPAF